MNETRCAGVAQLVEQLICNQQVGGSSPSTSSTISKSKYGRFPEWPKGADCKSVVNDFGGSNPPPPTKRQSIERCSVFLLLSRFRIGAMDSKAGSWQHAGCMLQPAWLFRRKANPPPPTKGEPGFTGALGKIIFFFGHQKEQFEKTALFPRMLLCYLSSTYTSDDIPGDFIRSCLSKMLMVCGVILRNEAIYFFLT